MSQSADSSQRFVLIEPAAGDAAVTSWEDRDFPENLGRWIEEYHHVGNRGVFLWKWCLHAVQLITLSSVDANFRDETREIKFLIGMYNCLVDDVADEGHNHSFLQSLLTLNQGGTPQGDTPNDESIARFTTKVWKAIWAGARRLPRYSEFATLLAFDLKQLATTIEHSDLVHQLPELMNPVEHDLYSSHGMMVTIAATVDLMASPAFRRSELGTLRTILWHAESMARIGNMVSTWEREIASGDFSSGVFMEAVWRGVLVSSDLRPDNRDKLLQAIISSNIEEDFLRRWESHRRSILERGASLSSIDVQDYTSRLDQLLESEIVSHGRK